VLPVAAQAWPSGRVAQEAYEHIAGRIVDAVAQGCDAVLLDLHGAMVSERFEDGEGELLARIRRVAPRVPIGVAHDMHANLFRRPPAWPRRLRVTRPTRTSTCTRPGFAPPSRFFNC